MRNEGRRMQEAGDERDGLRGCAGRRTRADEASPHQSKERRRPHPTLFKANVSILLTTRPFWQLTFVVSTSICIVAAGQPAQSPEISGAPGGERWRGAKACSVVKGPVQRKVESGESRGFLACCVGCGADANISASHTCVRPWSNRFWQGGRRGKRSAAAASVPRPLGLLRAQRGRGNTARAISTSSNASSSSNVCASLGAIAYGWPTGIPWAGLPHAPCDAGEQWSSKSGIRHAANEKAASTLIAWRGSPHACWSGGVAARIRVSSACG